MPTSSKSILITGCSSGIGLCAAQTLHKQGYRVFATARQQSDVDKLRSLGLESLILDINDSASIHTALATILDQTHGRLDALFNNAGFAQPGAVEDLTREMMRDQFETNVFGTIELTNAVLPIMRKQGFGRIIQNTSILGIITMPYRGAYNASKFALEGFSRTLRQELRGTAIHVSMLVPGPIQSQFRSNAYKNYLNTLAEKNSVHHAVYKKMEKYFFAPSKEERQFTLPPDAAVRALIKALESPRPRVHYYIGMPAYVFALLRRVLPDCALDWVLHQVTRQEVNIE
jgi:NAD(P)-dependent dehydrogenase (short-subunit alcohol dehydrogenase family)